MYTLFERIYLSNKKIYITPLIGQTSLWLICTSPFTAAGECSLYRMITNGDHAANDINFAAPSQG